MEKRIINKILPVGPVSISDKIDMTILQRNINYVTFEQTNRQTKMTGSCGSFTTNTADMNRLTRCSAPRDLLPM